MANVIQWEAAWGSGSSVLTTEMNSLGNGSRTDQGTEFDNSSSLDQYGAVLLYIPSGATPTAGGYVQIHLLSAHDGTNYPKGSSTVDPGGSSVVATMATPATASPQYIPSKLFRIPPTKLKLILLNRCGAAFPASGNTLTLYTTNDEVQ